MINSVEAAKAAYDRKEYKKAAVIMTFAEQSMLLQRIDRSTVPGMAYKVTREGALGGAAFRGLGEAYTESSGTFEEMFESFKFAGGDIDVDRALVVQGGPEMRTKHEKLKVKGLAQKIGYSLIKGSVNTEGGATADIKSIQGLQARFGGGFSGVAVNTNVTTSNQLVANNGASNALSIAKLDETIMKVDNCNALLMSRKCAINITTLLRNSASIQTTRDEFGRVVTTYNGLPILYADINGDLAGLAFDEGANSNKTSVYALNLSEDACKLIQSEEMSVRDLGEQNSKPVFRTRIEWYVGLALEGPRDVARLYDIADLTAVAA